jgi:hypothetical protein
VDASPRLCATGCAESFLLLPEGSPHDEAPLPSLATVEAWYPPPPPIPAHHQPPPAPPEGFLGRNPETARVVAAVLDRRLVTITGDAGIGKSAVAVAAMNFLASRRHFRDGLVYIDCAAAGDAAALDSILWSKIATVELVAPGAVGKSALRRSAVAPLQALHCLLVLDNLSAELTSSAPFIELLELLLSFARVRTLLTTACPIAQPLRGGAEKVVDLQPLSPHSTARLLCRLSPRQLLLRELPGADTTAEFLRMLSRHEITERLGGNPGRVKEEAPRLLRTYLDGSPLDGTY